jgi:formylglycine-generating enzyme required for sulfatase activity
MKKNIDDKEIDPKIIIIIAAISFTLIIVMAEAQRQEHLPPREEVKPVTTVVLNKEQKRIETKKLLRDIRNNMVLINKGEFLFQNKYPVKIDYNFYIGKYEVTFEQYDLYCSIVGKVKPKDGDYRGAMGREKRPVHNISWYDAKEFTNWLSEVSGQKFRLPSETEWEYVARDSLPTKNYDEYIWYDKNSKDMTNLVGLKKPNKFGLYDIYGNVSEWCEDWYNKANTIPKDGTPNKVVLEEKKINKGSSYNSYLDQIVDLSSRVSTSPNLSLPSIGFRVVKEE